MKKLITILAMAIFTLTLFIGFTPFDVCADDAKLTQKQELILQVDRLQATIDYTIRYIEMVKKEVGVISKDSTNPFHNSKYFDINSLLHHIEPLLEKYGLMCLQPLGNGKVITLIIDTETGAEMVSEMADKKSVINS